MPMLKQEALPGVSEQRIGETPNQSLSASALLNKAEGDAEYLSLARDVRDEVKAFVEQLDEGGTLECLISCDDYDDNLLTSHLRFADQYLRRAVTRLESAVRRLEEILGENQRRN